MQLACNNTIDFLENFVVGFVGKLLGLALNDIGHSIKVLSKPRLNFSELRVLVVVQLVTLCQLLHVVLLVVSDVRAGSLLETDHVFGDRLVLMAEELGG